MLRKFTKQTSAIHFGNSIGSILTVIFLLGFSYSANAQIVPIQNLRWSPDGKSLLFDLNQTTIYSVSATPGSKPIPYLPGQATKNSEASFLPNGSIVFTSDRNSNFDIFSESNKKVTALTTDPLNQKSPSVSHDGKKIVFLQETADESDIYNACVMNANGNDSKRVEITAKNVKSPSWLDNNTILCSIKEAAIPFEICALDITTKKYLKLTDNKFM
ncbi:MAG: hypothetical protein LH473_08255, partial [Chitinophagales bacterium]|nr:hypothetical protein [Chitinophagales bacterium]